MKNLVIVESPAKAKTIEKYLGKDFHVLSSVGHIRSIPVKSKVPPIDIKHDFKTIYEIDPDKKKVISELKKNAKAAESVWLATDEDREGEAIAWHLAEVLKLNPKTTKRITFHEITKDAIAHAIKNPRTIDMQLVQAQQARQILDRLVGFELSPVVWRKVPGGKSAGRVQSPAVRLVIEREQEIRDFAAQADFKITAVFNHDRDFKAEVKTRAKDQATAKQVLEKLINNNFIVTDIKASDIERNPRPPFTTSTLQQEANSKFGFSSKQTMSAAQKLYQAGKITYMRTDSTILSKQIIAAARDYITKTYGEKYHKARNFTHNSATAQEAHEAIRPTNLATEIAGSSPQEKKLYDLIRKRTLASQMSPALIKKTTAEITATPAKVVFVAQGEVVDFPGFLALYEGLSTDQPLPDLYKGDNVALISAEARQTFKKPPARFTEGSLVKKLEELGIGRPSTYATILDTIITRGYVAKGQTEGTERQVSVIKLENNVINETTATEKTGSDKGKLVPQPIGELLNTFLTSYFDQIVDYGFTANVETEFDQIATGKLDKIKMLRSFYEPFHKLIEESGGIKRSEISMERELGIDPKTKLPVIAKLGRFGPMIQLGSTNSDSKPKFAPMPINTSLNTVTLEQALEMFKLPRVIGETSDGQEILANVGRFGPYIKIGAVFISIKPHDPFSIDLATARQLYQEKLDQEAKKQIADFGQIKVLNGRFGPYVTDGVKNVKIAKTIDPISITQAQAEELLAGIKTSPEKASSKSPKTKSTRKSNPKKSKK
ncbi:MAG: type I DNA topoisomerase [Candidatus Saccharibacteria bacterium]|nr:type I DNA topoisomerase [Candidatus Saccharibacteria bacterium]